MPEKDLVSRLHEVAPAAIFAALRALIAIGQVLLSKEVITWRLVIGRCISTSGIAMCAGAALTVFPEMSLVAQIGIACLLASLGNSALEIVIQRIFGGAR